MRIWRGKWAKEKKRDTADDIFLYLSHEETLDGFNIKRIYNLHNYNILGNLH